MGRKRSTRLDLPPGMQFIKGRYYFIQTKGARTCTALGANFVEAKRLWVELTTKHDNAGKNTFSGLIDRFILEVIPRKDKHGKHELSDKTRYEYTKQAETLRKVFGHMQPRDIKPMHVAKFLRSHPAKVMANREKALMSTIFTNAMEWGVVDSNPCSGVKRNKERARERLPTDEERKLVKAAACPQLRLMTELVEVTGMRQQNARLIMLQHITQDGLIVRQQKTGVQQLFVRTPELEAIIDEALELRRGSLSMYLFVTRRGKPYTLSGIQSAWRRAIAKTGIKGLHFHDFRADAATEADDQGEDAQKLMGHLDGRTTRIYLRNRKPKRVTPIKRTK